MSQKSGKRHSRDRRNARQRDIPKDDSPLVARASKLSDAEDILSEAEPEVGREHLDLQARGLAVAHDRSQISIVGALARGIIPGVLIGAFCGLLVAAAGWLDAGVSGLITALITAATGAVLGALAGLLLRWDLQRPSASESGKVRAREFRVVGDSPNTARKARKAVTHPNG